MSWPWETRTSTCLNFATISSGLYRFLAIAVLLDVETYLKSDHFVGGGSLPAPSFSASSWRTLPSRPRASARSLGLSTVIAITKCLISGRPVNWLTLRMRHIVGGMLARRLCHGHASYVWRLGLVRMGDGRWPRVQGPFRWCPSGAPRRQRPSGRRLGLVRQLR